MQINHGKLFRLFSLHLKSSFVPPQKAHVSESCIYYIPSLRTIIYVSAAFVRFFCYSEVGTPRRRVVVGNINAFVGLERAYHLSEPLQNVGRYGWGVQGMNRGRTLHSDVTSSCNRPKSLGIIAMAMRILFNSSTGTRICSFWTQF